MCPRRRRQWRRRPQGHRLALPLAAWGWDINLVKAGAVPVIAFLVWLAIRGVRAHINEPEAGSDS
ncbi:MAG: hypothetical protein ACPGSQ_09365 [Candidatus Puniceispirillaceae bacterium]